HLIRDGRDVALSLRKMWFSPGWDIRTQAKHWTRFVKTARKAGVGRPDYLEVRYEDLILDTRASLERLCSFVGLRYEDSMMRYHDRASERLREHKGRANRDGTLWLSQEQRLAQ